jgi:flagellar protein FliO/FliZ
LHFSYFLNVFVMLLLVAGLAVGTLYLWRRLQPGISLGQRERAVKVVDAVPFGATGRLAVVEFSDKRLLIAVSRGRIEKIAEAPIGAHFSMPDED